MWKVIDVVIVDDQEVVLEGLRAIIQSRGHRVVAEAGLAQAAFDLVAGLSFDLLIVDCMLPGNSGVALVRDMRRAKRREPILMLTAHEEPTLVAEALAAGANGFALKSDSREELLDAIEQVASGHRYLSARLPLATVEGLMQRQAKGSTLTPLSMLSSREREIFELLVRGLDNGFVARELKISVNTVETHRARIFSKLNVHSMVELLRFAVRNQMVPVSPVAEKKERGDAATASSERAVAAPDEPEKQGGTNGCTGSV